MQIANAITSMALGVSVIGGFVIGAKLGALPPVMGFWGGMVALFHCQGRCDDARCGLGSRVTALEGRLLRVETTRQRGGTGA